ncbi:ATP-grasp fold amidoligase family protein [uncultured Clostridium sp.]|uniref:ATP-grasp fold amidoligase family protein n=1 Tax=uncultured Clostridium sp. TaxID=59620 RepID=UPI0026DB3FF9|nr:ATP-grasp fold amidoligase family protein [uncultured Clostridium sp.]
MNDINVAKKVYRKLLRVLPTKIALYIIYFRGYKKILNLSNPQTWGEKIQWLKLYGGLENLSDYVDKYKVRDYVKDTIGETYLNELYGVYDSIDEINFDVLPNKFVLKSTNGSGTVLVCKDIDSFDLKKAKHEMKKWLNDDYWKEKKEPQYKNVKNRIIIEKYLEDESGSLTDYKFYCFNGKVKYYAVFYDRYTNKSIDVYSSDNERLDNVKGCNIQNSDYIISNFENINTMIKLSEKLGQIFTCVRVDFYCIQNKPVFGELTFTDGAGSDSWNPIKFDLEIASNISLSKVLLDKNIREEKF